MTHFHSRLIKLMAIGLLVLPIAFSHLAFGEEQTELLTSYRVELPRWPSEIAFAGKMTGVVAYDRQDGGRMFILHNTDGSVRFTQNFAPDEKLFLVETSLSENMFMLVSAISEDTYKYTLVDTSGSMVLTDLVTNSPLHLSPLASYLYTSDESVHSAGRPRIYSLKGDVLVEFRTSGKWQITIPSDSDSLIFLQDGLTILLMEYPRYNVISRTTFDSLSVPPPGVTFYTTASSRGEYYAFTSTKGISFCNTSTNATQFINFPSDVSNPLQLALAPDGRAIVLVTPSVIWVSSRDFINERFGPLLPISVPQVLSASSFQNRVPVVFGKGIYAINYWSGDEHVVTCRSVILSNSHAYKGYSLTMSQIVDGYVSIAPKPNNPANPQEVRIVRLNERGRIVSFDVLRLDKKSD